MKYYEKNNEKLFYGLNDYELLYLIKEGCLVAYDLMIEKYSFLIKKKIKDFYVRDCDIDDYYQEGIIILNQAIYSFKDEYNKSFMRFFELLLKNRFINLRRKDSKSICDYLDEDFASSENIIAETVAVYTVKSIHNNLTSKLEKIVFDEYFLKQSNIKDICEKNVFSRQQVYNAIKRIRKKI